MNADELEYIQSTVDNEGFDYAFRHYSSFENVKDEDFHRLRSAYVAAAEDLAAYCGVD